VTAVNGETSVPDNKLYYGDNLAVLREHLADASVDLIYLDPPFNSNASYNILFKSPAGAIWRGQSHNDRTWYDKLCPSFRSSPTGKIDGFGLARFPKAGWFGNILD
jgi:predicted methyltransferase